MSFFRKTKSEEQQPSKVEKVVGPPEEKKIKQPSVTVPPPQKSVTEEDDKQSSGLFNRFQKKSAESERVKKSSRLKTIIGKTVAVHGEISGGEEVLVEGSVEGDIYILSKLNIGISGNVKGKIEAQEIRVAGKSNGELNATNKIEVASTGDVVGQINTPRIIVLEGAALKGKISTSKSSTLKAQERLKLLDTKADSPKPAPKEAPKAESEPEAKPDPVPETTSSTHNKDQKKVESDPKTSKIATGEPPLFSKIKEIETGKASKPKK